MKINSFGKEVSTILKGDEHGEQKPFDDSCGVDS